MVRLTLCLLTLLVLAGAASAQIEVDALPSRHVPLHDFTSKELQQRQALYRFAEGLLAEHEDRLLEALQLFEQAAFLDTDAVPVLKALVMMYISLERYDDALALSKQVLKLDPHDYQISYLYARQLRGRNQLKEACEVLQRGLQSPGLVDRPDLAHQMEYDLGILHERLEQYAQAGAAYSRAAAILDHNEYLEERGNPEELKMRSAEVHERAGRNFLDGGDYAEAIKAFRRAQEKYPAGAGRLQFHLAQVYSRQGKIGEALVALDNYLAMLPQGTDAYEMKIALLQKSGSEAEVLPWLEKACDKDQFNVGLKLLLARQCARLQQTATAERIYHDLAETAPTDDVYREMFRLYQGQPTRGSEFVLKLIDTTLANATRKDNPLANSPAPAQARAMIEMLRTNPDVARPIIKAAAQGIAQRRLHPDTLQLLAAVADRGGLLPEAEVLYGECLKGPLTPATEPLLYGSLLRVLWKAQHYEAIVERCRAGLKQTQTNNRVLLRADLARALAVLERYNEALVEADQAVGEAQEGEQFAVRLLRLRIVLQAGKLGEAETECQTLLQRYPMPGDILEVRYLLSSIYTAAKRLPQAEAELAECLKIDPSNAAVNNDLGYLWTDENKNLPQAEALIRKAIDQDRKNRQSMLALRPGADKEFHDNACYIDSLGWVLFRRGQVDEARKQLQYAATLPEGDDPVIWDHLGEVRLALGDAAGAAQAWRQALDFYEHDKRRKIDERYRALQQKLQQLDSNK
jgi:tetratricopeptide (TPR) repeat protein